MTLPTDSLSPDLWHTTASDGTVLASDSDLNSMHFVFNSSLYDTIVTCLHTGDEVCCVTYSHEQGTTNYNGWTTVEFEACDTVYVNTVEYIELVDTLTEFVSNTTYVDCATGQPCNQQSLYDLPSTCAETSIYAPNSVSLSNTWYVTADDGCWYKWELRIYDILGNLVWTSYSMYDEWDASVVPGTYVYTISTNSYVSGNTFNFNGTIIVY